jgi:trigger factor
MQVTETSAEGLKREFKVVVPAQEIDHRVTNRLSELSGQVRLPGFRPGKVPMSLLRKRFGDSVMGEVLEGAVNETSQAAIAERGLRPAMQPKIEVTNFEKGGDLEYKMDLEVLPEVEAPDVGAIEVTRPVAQVGEDHVDETLERLAGQRKKFEAPDEPRPAQSGDRVVIDFEGRLDGGEPRPEMTSEDFALELGSGQFIPGFEEQLIGAAPGDEKTVELTFPEDYPSEEHANKPASFKVTVKEVQEPKEMTVGDDLATEYGFDDLDSLKTAIRDQTQQEFDQAARARAKRNLLDRLAESHDFEVPAGMVDQEFDQIWRQVEQALEHHRETKDDPEHMAQHPHDPELDKPEEELREEYRKIAERRVRLGLILSEIGREAGVEVTQEELNRAVFNEARKYQGQERQVLEFFQKNPQAIEGLRAPLYEDKVVDYILERAKVEDTPVSPEELMRDPDEAAGEAGGESDAEAEAAGADEAPAKKAAAKKTTAKKAAPKKGGAEADPPAEAATEQPAKKTGAKSKAKSTTKADAAEAGEAAADGGSDETA